MTQSISRSFPGGPGKRVEVPAPTVSERMKRVEEIEGRVAERRKYLKRREWWHRLKTVLVASTVLAAGAGLYMSLHQRPDPDGPVRMEEAGVGGRIGTIQDTEVGQASEDVRSSPSSR